MSIRLKFSLYFQKFRMSGRNVKHFRKIESASRGTRYSRSRDCWNCGLPHHQSKNCTARKVLRCSFCRRTGIRSDECSCRRNRDFNRNRDAGPSNRGRSISSDQRNRSHDDDNDSVKFEACVLVTVCQKQVKAVVSPGDQESRIGKKVVTLIKESMQVVPRRKIIKTKRGLELAQTIMVKVGTRRSSKLTIECVIDHTLPVNELSLGMKALIKMGYSIKVAGQETTQRRIVRKTVKSKRGDQKFIPQLRRDSDESDSDDKLSFLDEDEAKRILEF